MKPIYRVLLLLFFSSLFTTSCDDSQTDKTYSLVRNPQPTEKPTVVEFFAYFCPHCSKLEPKVRAWEKKLPKSVSFIKVPLTLGHNQARVYSRAFYLGKKLGVFDKSHKRIFRDFHSKGIQIQTDQQLKKLFLDLGVTEQAFDTAISDPSINQQVEKAEQLAKQFGIISVPGFVVNGQYFTDVAKAGGERELFEKINFLLRKKK